MGESPGSGRRHSSVVEYIPRMSIKKRKTERENGGRIVRILGAFSVEVPGPPHEALWEGGQFLGRCQSLENGERHS